MTTLEATQSFLSTIADKTLTPWVASSPQTARSITFRQLLLCLLSRICCERARTSVAGPAALAGEGNMNELQSKPLRRTSPLVTTAGSSKYGHTGTG